MYAKISKWIFWVLVLISVAIMIFGAVGGGFTRDEGMPVNILMDWTYILFFGAIALVVLLGIILGAINNPKGLLRAGIILACACCLVVVVYLFSSSAPLMNYFGSAQPSKSELRISDTLLNLTYLLGAVAILSIIVGEIVRVVRNK